MDVCSHQVQYNGLCAVCGTLLESLSDEEHINMSYDNIGLTVSRLEAERLEVENAKRLLKEEKLSLILDLDQTIVHASCDPQIGQWKNSEICRFTLPNSPTLYYIKFRPGLNQFLKEIESLYDLHIYTMGTKDYAKAVAREIDPEGRFFRERILSRDESGCLTQKKLQRIFPCDTSMVVVLDDRSDVWSYSPNLVRIKPYEYFIGTGDIHSPAKNKEEKEVELNPTSEKDSSDEHKDQDTELYTMLDILKQIHQEFYQNKDEGDVTKIIPKMKRKVLSNCIISFAPDVIPSNLKEPTLSWIWQMATSFGGSCSTDLTGKTTHLIAVRWDTKARAAKNYGHSKIVTPAWLLDSTARWSIQSEDMYSLQNEPDTQTPDSGSLENSLFERDEEEQINVDWDEVNKEVDDFMNESGIDDEGDTTDSDSTTQAILTKVDSPTASLHKKWKRKRGLGIHDENGSNDEDNGNNKQRVRKKGKSQLSKVTTLPNHDAENDSGESDSSSSSSDSSSSNSSNSSNSSSSGSDSSSSSESESKNNNNDTSIANSDDDDDLDSFAGILEEELWQS